MLSGPKDGMLWQGEGWGWQKRKTGGSAREEGIFPLFLKEEGGEQKGEQGQDSGGCRESGGLSAEKGTDLGFQAPCPGG